MIVAQTKIARAKKQVTAWFKDLKATPDRYRFSSHQGVVVLKGSLDKPGGVFETKEQFGGVTIPLRFAVTRVNSDSFRFKLIKPFGSLRISGQFLVEELSPKTTKLTLRIFGENPKTVLEKIGQGLLFCSPLRWFILHQIRAETIFVKQAVESA
jgi:hypothetical protein